MRRNRRIEDVQATALATMRGIEACAREFQLSDAALEALIGVVVGAFQNQRAVILGTATEGQRVLAEVRPSRAVVEGMAQVLEERP
jgi:urease accessory protein UreF